MAKRIVWHRLAIIEKKKIYSFWNKRNKSKKYSQKLRIVIRSNVKRLSENSNIGYQTNIKSVRIIPISHFLLIYKVRESDILILAFWDARQNPDKMNSAQSRK